MFQSKSKAIFLSDFSTPRTPLPNAFSRSDVVELKVQVDKWKWHSTSASVGEVGALRGL